MRIHTSIEYTEFDTLNGSDNLRSVVSSFTARPSLANFTYVIEQMQETMQEVPYGEQIILRVSLTEKEEASFTLTVEDSTAQELNK